MKYADIQLNLTVAFQDEGTSDLRDQAIEMAFDTLGISHHDVDAEVIGQVRDTVLPRQKETNDAVT